LLILKHLFDFEPVWILKFRIGGAMSKRVEALVKKEKEKAVEVMEAKTELTQRDNDLIHSSQVLGAAKAIAGVAAFLGSQAIKGLEQFAEQKMYVNFGYTSMADFLEQSPHAPCSKNQYHDRLKALREEGADTFDALNSLNVPLSKRRLLGKGSVSVEGGDIIIGEERIALTDKERIARAITALADSEAEKTRTLERKDKKLKKGEEENKELKRKLDQALRSGGLHASQLPASAAKDALFDVVISLSALSVAIAELDPEEIESFRAESLKLISQNTQKVADAFNADPKEKQAKAGDTEWEVSEEALDAMADAL
jgi:HPt (histidine-containing phosphotransfer) domain-containing protein